MLFPYNQPQSIEEISFSKLFVASIKYLRWATQQEKCFGSKFHFIFKAKQHFLSKNQENNNYRKCRCMDLGIYSVCTRDSLDTLNYPHILDGILRTDYRGIRVYIHKLRNCFRFCTERWIHMAMVRMDL